MTNAIKVLLQRQSGFLQLESTLYIYFNTGRLYKVSFFLIKYVIMSQKLLK
jgi:hypothetical protein